MRAAEIAGTSTTGRSATGRNAAGRRPSYRQRSLLDRFGGLILTGFAVVGIAALGFLLLQSSTQRAYACDRLMTPGPTDPIPTATPAPTASPGASPSPTPAPTASPGASPSPTPSPTPTATPAPTASPTPASSPSPTPAPTPTPTPEPAPTQRLGFTASDLGATHIVDQSKKVDYPYCPPASGPHWNVSRLAPVPRAFYQPQDAVQPQQWLHNVEHGFVILLYSCGVDGKSCPSSDDMAKLRKVFDETPPTAGAVSCSIPNKLIVARFDEMATRFGLVAWDREMLTDTLDVATAMTFIEQFTDGPATPEAGACF
jgi:hypothetical protein